MQSLKKIRQKKNAQDRGWDTEIERVVSTLESRVEEFGKASKDLSVRGGNKAFHSGSGCNTSNLGL